MTLMMRGTPRLRAWIESVAARGNSSGVAERRAPQPMVDVVGGLVGVERRQVIADRDPLPQLLELRRRELVAQVRLADQHDLQQLRFLGLEVREHAQLFERAEAQVLRLVDDQQHQPSGETLVDQVLRQVAHQQRLAAARRDRARSRS